MKLTLVTIAFQATLLCHETNLAVAEYSRRELLQVFKDYGQPDPNVSKIDLDQRSVIARTALASNEGLEKALQAYKSSGNVAPISLQSLSTGDDVFRNFDLFNSFKTFYDGDKFYADSWIQAAFKNSNLSLGSREANFVKLNAEGRSSAVRWGTVTLNVFMGTVSCLHQAFEQCDSSPDEARDHWNKAFAYYTGSLAEAEHPLGGYLLYNFVQMQSEHFGTVRKGQESPTNKKILGHFLSGKEHLSGGKCSALKNDVKKIQTQLTVPLIQASLRAIYAMDLEDDTRQEIQGEAAAFSAAVAPIVGTCSGGSADIIYQDMAPGKGPQGSYEVVKAAFERNYDCLQITCADVGGLVTLTGEYSKRAEACDNVQPVPGAGALGYPDGEGGGSLSSTSNDSPYKDSMDNLKDGVDSETFALAMSLATIFSFFLGIFVGSCCCRRKKKAIDAFTSKEEDFVEAEKSGLSEEVEGSFDVEKITENLEVV